MAVQRLEKRVRALLAFFIIAYGTDWLAFAHITIAVAFLGPLKDPVRNRGWSSLG